MKSRLTLIFSALVVLLGAMVWVVEDRATVATSAAAVTPLPLRVLAPFHAGAAPEQSSQVTRVATAAAPTPAAMPAVGRTVVPARAAASPRLERRASAPTVRVAASGDTTYVARPGDTVSELAGALLGSDSPEHRDAVIDANPSLHADPDRVLAGETYLIDPTPTHTADDAPDGAARGPVATAPDAASSPATKGKPEAAAAARKMTYMARVGDTVRVLAAHLLGGDTKANRDAILGGNPSLRRDPDHLVAGQNYTIVAPDGLAADPDAPQPQASSSEPEADEVVRLSTGRSLRYTARAGDTVSKLAAALLGGDTRANRESIINDNPGLKDDPDHLVAGQTYWVTAPMAD